MCQTRQTKTAKKQTLAAALDLLFFKLAGRLAHKAIWLTVLCVALSHQLFVTVGALPVLYHTPTEQHADLFHTLTFCTQTHKLAFKFAKSTKSA